MQSQQRQLDGKRILVVDDSDQIVQLVDEVLTRRGAEVCTASGGQDAISQLHLGSFDLVILDLVMPKPDGMDVLHYLHTHQRDLLDRTLVLTGDRYTERMINFLDVVEIPTLYKPFRIDELRTLVGDLLNGKPSRSCVA